MDRLILSISNILTLLDSYLVSFRKPMKTLINPNLDDINWDTVTEILKTSGMSYQKPMVHKRAFQASYRKVFIFSGSKLIGFGRAISDGEYQAAFYDISVLPSFQGKGVGKTIVSALKDGLSNCNIIFYSTPGMEGFYKKQGFHSLSTGMGLFSSTEANKKLTY